MKARSVATKTSLVLTLTTTTTTTYLEGAVGGDEDIATLGDAIEELEDILPTIAPG